MRLLRLLTLSLVLATPLVGHAAEPSPTARTQAQTVYAEGEKAFGEKRFEDALASFEKAYLLDPVPILLYNIARANEELGRFAEATRYFESYLARVPDAKDRREVEGRLAILRKAAKASKEAEVAKAEAVKAKAEAEAAKAAKAKAESDKAKAEEARLTGTRETGRRSNWLAWTLMGTGGGLFLFGLASWGQAAGAVSEAEDIVNGVDGSPTDQQEADYIDARDRAESAGTTGWVLVGLGVVAGVVGYFMYEDAPDDAPAVGVVPTLNGLGVVGTF